MRSRGRNLGSRLRFNDGDETRDRIATFEQPSHLLDLFRLEGPFNDGGQKIQRLAAEEIHGAKRFQKDRGRSSHASFHYRIGNSFEQDKIFGCEQLGPGLGRKGVGEFCADLVPFLRKRCLGKGSHKCLERQPKSTIERHYMEGVKESQ